MRRPRPCGPPTRPPGSPPSRSTTARSSPACAGRPAIPGGASTRRLGGGHRRPRHRAHRRAVAADHRRRPGRHRPDRATRAGSRRSHNGRLWGLLGASWSVGTFAKSVPKDKAGGRSPTMPTWDGRPANGMQGGSAFAISKREPGGRGRADVPALAEHRPGRGEASAPPSPPRFPATRQPCRGARSLRERVLPRAARVPGARRGRPPRAGLDVGADRAGVVLRWWPTAGAATRDPATRTMPDAVRAVQARAVAVTCAAAACPFCERGGASRETSPWRGFHAGGPVRGVARAHRARADRCTRCT